jgi:hypothetical protein
MKNLADLSINGIASYLQLYFIDKEIKEDTLLEIIDQILNSIENGKRTQLSSAAELLYQEGELGRIEKELISFLSSNNGIDHKIKIEVEKIYLEVITRLQGNKIVVKAPRKKFGNLTAQQIAFLFNALKDLNCINDRKTEVGDGLSILFGISSDNIRTRLSNSDKIEHKDYLECISFMEKWVTKLKKQEDLYKK